MAVEARNLSLFPSQMITRGNFSNINEGIGNICNAQVESDVNNALAQATHHQTFHPFHQSVLCDSVPVKSAMKEDSGLTYNFPPPRKRTREGLMNRLEAFNASDWENSFSGQFPKFLGEDFSLLIQQQQFEIDRFIADHTEKLRLELAERRKRHARALAVAMESAVAKKVREKEEEVHRMGKINWLLQEKVRALCVENQVWRELAHANEATVNSLRCNLERLSGGTPPTPAEDCASSCGDYVPEKRMRPASSSAAAAAGPDESSFPIARSGENCRNHMCRSCGERESSVLLLPCRHLCVCTMCGSSLRTCPACHATMNASVHVNMS